MDNINQIRIDSTNLYAFSASDGQISRYVFETNEWSVINTGFNTLFATGIAACNGQFMPLLSRQVRIWVFSNMRMTNGLRSLQYQS